jgi:citrate synthase
MSDNVNHQPSSESNTSETISTEIWQEIAEPSDPFSAQSCHCAGFNVYQDLLGQANWIEYLYLLFMQQQPSQASAELLNDVAVAIANAGPRDLSVQAAMSAGAGGSTLAACLIAALSVGAGQYQGAHEIYYAMQLWQYNQQNISLWQQCIKTKGYQQYHQRQAGHNFNVWPELEFPPGFSPYAHSCPQPVLQTLTHLANKAQSLDLQPSSNLAWLATHRQQLELATGMPLAITGVVAAALSDLQFDGQQAELLYLLLRLPGAAAHALEQHRRGWRDYPFHANGLVLTNDPGPYNKAAQHKGHSNTTTQGPAR